MKPVAIFRHSPTEGPGYFATFLEQHRIPWQLIKVDAGAAIPDDLAEFSGLSFMGGPMSVNDDLPWIPPTLKLIQTAVARGVPVLGHCLGGQLMAKALGGVVMRNPVKEIGWGTVRLDDHPLARHWLGEAAELEVFQWHGETFSIPPGATRLATNPFCANQMFALDKHLGMQCHVEMTADMVRTWCDVGGSEIATCVSPAVQQQPAITAGLEEHIAGLNATAQQIYNRWIAGLAA